jgi:hypothetical protein
LAWIADSDPPGGAVQVATKFVTLTVTFSVFLTSEATGLRWQGG